MADNSAEGDNEAAKKGSSSESSDVSIEKLNPEEPDINGGGKPTEDPNKETKAEGGEKDSDTKKSDTKDTVEFSDSDKDKSKKEEPAAASASASSTAVVRSAGSIEDSDENDDDDDFEDETFVERLIGLTEMFPSGLITVGTTVSHGSVSAVKWTYSTSRSLTWIVFSSAMLLFLPVMIESERASIEEQDKMRKQQMLLGPSSAISSAQNAPLPPNPI